MLANRDTSLKLLSRASIFSFTTYCYISVYAAAAMSEFEPIILSSEVNDTDDIIILLLLLLLLSLLLCDDVVVFIIIILLSTIAIRFFLLEWTPRLRLVLNNVRLDDADAGIFLASDDDDDDGLLMFMVSSWTRRESGMIILLLLLFLLVPLPLLLMNMAPLLRRGLSLALMVTKLGGIISSQSAFCCVCLGFN